jgi:hypothetical protein
MLSTEIARADESGISFWLPGLYGSLAATPTTPGWSVGAIYYHTKLECIGRGRGCTRSADRAVLSTST